MPLSSPLPMQAAQPSRTAHLAMAFGLALFVVLLCLIPKPENDLFFELRIGADILRTHRLPHVDTYSWTNAGTPWVVPEWLTFVLYALAFRAGGFFGTWLLMSVVVLAAAGVIGARLAKKLPIAWAFALSVLTLLALSDFIQERPYVFTYLFLAASLCIITWGREREKSGRALWALAPLCVLWTNLHPGVVSVIGILLAYALGDSIMMLRARQNAAEAARYARSARQMLAAALACAAAACITPYGPRIYWNVFITLHNRQLMANVTEWRPLTAVPLVQLIPFLLMLALSIAALALSRRPTVPDITVWLALLTQAIIHARGIPLFAVGMAIVGAPHFAALLSRLPARRVGSPPHPWRGPLLGIFAIVYAVTLTLVTYANLKRTAGPQGLSSEGIGEAVARVPSYPWAACAFIERERFPLPLRLLNNFEVGGFLMWRLPRQPVFVDGRLDVYAGRTFDDMLILSRGGGTQSWAALVQKYNLECVLTTSAHQAQAFADNPQWVLVYADPVRGRRPRCRILLRRRPQYASLIARCLRDGGTSPDTGQQAY